MSTSQRSYTCSYIAMYALYVATMLLHAPCFISCMVTVLEPCCHYTISIYSSTDFTRGDELNAVACTQAFKRHRHDLSVVIDHLLSYMSCTDLLPESTKERVEIASLSRMERSVLVLDAIEARIMDNPGIFHTFITVLQKDVVLQKFAGSLIDSYRKFPQ